jgi:hypothetical protein
MFRWTICVALALAAMPWAAAAAQESDRWEVSFTPYAWLASTKGQVGVGRNVVDVDLSFDDILEDLDLGLQGLLEARRDPWVGRLDGTYVATTSERQTVQAGATVGTRLEQDMVMLQPEVGYTVLARPWGGIDALGGIRYWHLSADLTLSTNGGPGITERAARTSPGRRWVVSRSTSSGGFRSPPRTAIWTSITRAARWSAPMCI